MFVFPSSNIGKQRGSTRITHPTFLLVCRCCCFFSFCGEVLNCWGRDIKQEPKKHSKYFFLPLLPSSSRLPITVASFHSRKCISSDVAAILFGNVLMCLCISYMHESFQIKREKKRKKRGQNKLATPFQKGCYCMCSLLVHVLIL